MSKLERSKNKLNICSLFIIVFFLNINQSYGQIVISPKFEKGKLIKKITENTYQVNDQDSIVFTDKHSEILVNSKVKDFDRAGNLIKEEFYKEGKLTNSRDFIYKNNKLIREQYDTTLKTTFSSIEYSYPENEDYVEVQQNYSNNKKGFFRFQNDARGNTIMESLLDSDKKPVFVYKYIYDEYRKPLIVSTFKDNVRDTQRIYVYDSKENIKRVLLFSSDGNIIRRTIYTNINDNEIAYVEIDENTKKQKESRIIVYKNNDGTTHKQYLQTHYFPNKWDIKEFKYEFYN